MKIAIIGAGAMGSLFGARLALSGQQVSFIEVSEQTIARIRQDGLQLSDDAGTSTVRVPIGKAASFGEPFDMIVVFTKGFHTAGAVQSIAHLVGPATWALSLQNGLGNAEIISTVIARERIIIGMTNFPADLKAPGVVHSHGDGQVKIWTMSGEASAEVANIATALNKAGLSCSADPRVQEAIWEKLAFNAALNSICAVTGLTVGAAGTTLEGRGLAFRIAEETVSVARALGIEASSSQVENALEHAFQMHVHHKPSMLQDMEAGRKTEIDFINGAVVERASQTTVSVPTVAALYQLVKMMEMALNQD